MTTRITQIDDQIRNRMLLRLEGTVSLEDAKLIEEICTDLRNRFDYRVTIDLAGVDFVGNESAAILRRLNHVPEVNLQGMRLFVQQMIALTETTQQFD